MAHLDRGHDGFHVFGVEFEDAVEDADFVITEGLLSGAMELEERLELRLLVRVCLVRAEDMVQKLGDGPGDWGWCGENLVRTCLKGKGSEVPNKYMRQRTKGAQRAPIARPYLTLIACGMILTKSRQRSRRARRGEDVLAVKCSMVG